jgi:hypothetical protein
MDEPMFDALEVGLAVGGRSRKLSWGIALHSPPCLRRPRRLLCPTDAGQRLAR